MSGVKDCPKCRLVNSPSAQRCDCGYDFVSRKMDDSYLGAKAGRDMIETASIFELLICLILPVIGLILGVLAKNKGRIAAGSRMIKLSLIMIVLINALPFLIGLIIVTVRS